MRFNPIRIPRAFLAVVAEDAAFDALAVYHYAERELALPRPLRRPAPAIHAEVIRANRVAVWLQKELR